MDSAVAERFMKYVDDGPNDCLVWTGADAGRALGYGNEYNYGKLHADGTMQYAHRLAFEHYRGPIGEGVELDHLCRTPRCINPWHLEPVSHAINGRRGIVGWNSGFREFCPKGHPYSAENTRMYNGRRHCRECGRRANQACRAKRKEH